MFSFRINFVLPDIFSCTTKKLTLTYRNQTWISFLCKKPMLDIYIISTEWVNIILEDMYQNDEARYYKGVTFNKFVSQPFTRSIK